MPLKPDRFFWNPGDLVEIKPKPGPRFHASSTSMAARGELKAPKGKFRVIAVDTFESPCADCHLGDFTKKADAIRQANAHGGPMNPVYVYTDKGELIHEAGSK